MNEIILTSIITALATSIFTNVAYYFKEKRLHHKQMKFELLGQMMGSIQLLRQLYVNKFEDDIDTDFYKGMWRLHPGEVFYSEESKRLNRNSRELSIEVAKSRGSFFENVYKIESLFLLDEKTKLVLQELKNHKTPLVKDFLPNLSEKELKRVQGDSKNQLHKLVDQELYQPCKFLYEYLKRKAQY